MCNEINRPIILFGTGRSGSTILMEAIFRHPDLAYLSNYLEKKPSWLFLNYLRFVYDNKIYRIFGRKKQLYGRKLAERLVFKPSEGYPIWRYLLHNEHDFSRSFLYEESPENRTIERVNKYLGQIQYIQRKSKFAIKITGPSRLYFMHSLFPDGKFIWVRRSFIPTLNSFLNVDFWQNRKTKKPWWHGPYSEREMHILDKYQNDPVIFTGIQLKKINDLAQKEIDELKLDVFKIDYENFVAYPETVLKQLLDFAELTHNDACFEYLKNNRPVNRNKPIKEYFDDATLNNIEQVLNISLNQ